MVRARNADVSKMSLMDFSPATGAQLVDSGLEVVVTGGGGWLGQATLEMLESSLGTRGSRTSTSSPPRRRSMTLRSGTRLEVYPLR